MQDNKFIDLLLKNRFYDPLNKWLSQFIENNITSPNKDEIMLLFNVYFVLTDDGNCCMSLDKDIVQKKWEDKCDKMKKSLSETARNEDYIAEIEYLKEAILPALPYLDNLKSKDLENIIGEKKLFQIENNYIFLDRYYKAILRLRKSVKRLFMGKPSDPFAAPFDYTQYTIPGVKLTDGQKDIVTQGETKNLVVTGGPGTGKTTSILFLLAGIIKNNPNHELYLTAPSGKAASRMLESIFNNMSLFRPDFWKNEPILEKKLLTADSYTIHRLLKYNAQTGDFTYGENHQFLDESIFVIDEASMIDVELFNSLLAAIPNKARVFILGDKEQLPSVGCGAVLSDLLDNKDLKDNGNIVELSESKRFKKETEIWELSDEIKRNDVKSLPKEWQDLKDFQVLAPNSDKCPIYYYQDIADKKVEKEQLISTMKKWGTFFYSDFLSVSKGINATKELDAINRNRPKEEQNKLLPKDKRIELEPVQFDIINDKIEEAKILCASNEGARGIKTFNKYIQDNFFANKKFKTPIPGYYPGDILMLEENNQALDLYNGDTGTVVQFDDENTLYFMIKKSSKLIEREGKNNDKIFKLGSYLFYPLRMLDLKNVTLAFAITIHKSQGSDYKQIFVVLPKEKGHPLLNKQIVYTAITRTKGNTYIYSNTESILEAAANPLLRDTRLFD